MHPELLIKIAIINFASPADADCVAAHKPLDCGRIKRSNEQVHVFAELAVVPQIRSKAPDWEIRNRVKLVKNNAEMFFELALVIGLQFGLRTRQERADRIVNQMQRQFRFDPVA